MGMLGCLPHCHCGIRNESARFETVIDRYQNAIGNYVEIKNYNSSRLEAKLKYFPHEITVLYKNDLKNIFDYVISVYGKKYIELYEIKN